MKRVTYPKPAGKRISEMTDPEIVAVVVTYQPELDDLTKLLHALVGQVDTVIIVDNGSDIDMSLCLERYSSRELSVLRLGKNMGVAFAQNTGIREAMKMNATHVLLLDHDSIPDPNMVSVLMEAETKLVRAGKKVAAVGPRYKFHNTNLSSFFVRFGLFRFQKIYCKDEGCPEYVAADFLISSGCLISLKAMFEIGFMDESLFIDHVDTEWFLRAKTKGYEAFGVCNAVMEHKLGDYLFNFWFGKKRTLPVHSPLRLYYVFRNSILLYKRPCVSKKWIVNDVIRLCLMFILFSIRVSPRVKYFVKMTKGIYDGLRGRSGQYIASAVIINNVIAAFLTEYW
jgi:rhamnosyltransferase